MSSLPSNFSAAAIAEIRSRLDAVRANGPRILFAIESGSRAWGFPSPDSDYDCRFVYVRPARQHLVLQQPRDVIEYPIVDDVDAGGWDLRKALILALDGNAVVVEWANSPLVYEEIENFRTRFLDLLATIVDPTKVAQHYLGLARSHLNRIGDLDQDVNLKKLFYAIRPIVALEWMEQRNFDDLPPMNLPESLAQSNLPPDVESEIHQMIAEKALTREMGMGRAPRRIASYLVDRFEHFSSSMPAPQKSLERTSQDRALAEEFYGHEARTA